MSKYYYMRPDGKLYEIRDNVVVIDKPASEHQDETNFVSSDDVRQTLDESTITPVSPGTSNHSQVATTVQPKYKTPVTSKHSQVATTNPSPVASPANVNLKAPARRVEKTVRGRPATVTQNKSRVDYVKDQDLPQESPNLSKKQKKNQRVHDLFDDPDLIYSIESQLLTAVFCRPPLFDNTLRFQERSEDIKIRLFKEISKILYDVYGENISWQVVSNTWKHHRTLYIRYVNAKRAIFAGSSTARLPPAPEHYHILKEYDAVIEKRNQMSSLSKDQIDKFPPQKRSTNEESVNKYLKTANKFLETFDKAPTPTTSHSVRDLSESDPNYVFLCSLLPAINTLKAKDERNFKKNLLTNLYDCLDKYEEENEADQNQRLRTQVEERKQGRTRTVQNERVNPYDIYYGLYEDEDEN